jgi:transcriptional regulator with XRE-family HTH domain
MARARRARGLSQVKLALRAGVTPATIGNYETDKVAPGIMNLITLADALCISIDEYIGRTPPKEPKGWKYFGCF